MVYVTFTTTGSTTDSEFSGTCEGQKEPQDSSGILVRIYRSYDLLSSHLTSEDNGVGYWLVDRSWSVMGLLVSQLVYLSSFGTSPVESFRDESS